MTKKYKKIPIFKNEDEEREFWDTHDFTDYIDFSKALKNPEFPNLKQATKTISIRLPETMLRELKRLANRIDVPYQSFIKVILGNHIDNESITTHINNKESVLSPYSTETTGSTVTKNTTTHQPLLTTESKTINIKG